MSINSEGSQVVHIKTENTEVDTRIPRKHSEKFQHESETYWRINIIGGSTVIHGGSQWQRDVT